MSRTHNHDAKRPANPPGPDSLGTHAPAPQRPTCMWRSTCSTTCFTLASTMATAYTFTKQRERLSVTGHCF